MWLLGLAKEGPHCPGLSYCRCGPPPQRDNPPKVPSGSLGTIQVSCDCQPIALTPSLDPMEEEPQVPQLCHGSVPASLDSPDRPVPHGCGLRTMALPVNGGEEWPGKRTLPGAPRKNKNPPTEWTLELYLPWAPCAPSRHVACPFPSWCPMFTFPSITTSPRATPRLGAESRSSSIRRSTHHLGGAQKGARASHWTGLCSRQRGGGGGSKKWSTKLSKWGLLRAQRWWDRMGASSGTFSGGFQPRALRVQALV